VKIEIIRKYILDTLLN